MTKLQTLLADYSDTIWTVLPQFVLAIFVFFVFVFVAKGMAKASDSFSRRFTEDKSLLKLFRTVARVVTITIGLFVSASIVFPGLSAGHLVSVLGLSSVAIGFAFKDIFQNFLAGILILLQRPFQIGDGVVVNGFEGVVENITIRSTELKTYDSQKIIIPNSTMYSSPVQVRTAYETRRTTFTTGIGYDEDIDQGREVIREALKECEKVEETPAPQIFVSSHGDSSVNFDVRYWTNSKKSDVTSAKDQVATSVKYALDEADIEIPYPHRTVQFHDMDKAS